MTTRVDFTPDFNSVLSGIGANGTITIGLAIAAMNRIQREFNKLQTIKPVVAPPVNPDATARLVEALRAIVDWENRGSDYTIPVRLINDANNALHMAQLPVVPVSEDVETIMDALALAIRYEKLCYAEEMKTGYEPKSFAAALAALDRLAAAAGKHGDQSLLSASIERNTL